MSELSIMAHGSRLTAHGSRLTAHGSRLTAHGQTITLSHCNLSQFLKHIAFVLVFCLASFGVAWADVQYIDADGNTQTCTDFTAVTESSTEWSNGGWYVVNSNVTIPSRVTVSGTANLILSDGFKLTVNDGIGVGNNNTLTIYGQSGGTGTLETVNITDDNHAGIGGSSSMSAGGTITINGGIITARGGKLSAGIGGSWSGSGGTITINGGTVTAYGGDVGAGIGGGQGGSAGTISISGGSVTAIGSSISLNGLGELGEGGTISLGWKNEQDFIYANYYGGTITFQKEFLLDDGNGTVATANNIIYGAKIVPSSSVHTVTVGTDGISASRTHVFVGDTVTLNSNLGYPVVYYVDGTAIELNTFTMPNKDVTVTAVKAEGYVSYVDYDGSTKYVDGYATLGSETDTLSGWVYVAETLNLDKRLTVEGEAHLILRDGVTLTVNGINVTEGNSLTIYAQEGGTGTLTAQCAATSDYNAAIGGKEDNNITNCGNVTINGGTVNATGGKNSAGIGGAGGMGVQGGMGGNITVNRGTVNAQGGGNSGGAGIGGAFGNNGGTLTVNGGTVTATGGGEAAGIGGGGTKSGYSGKNTGGTVRINGGTVTANGGTEAAGIGGGKSANSGGTTKLGWTNTSDSIYASSYNGDVTFLSGFLLDGTATVATADNINGDVKKIVPNTATFNITTADGITSVPAYASVGTSVTLSGGVQEGYRYVINCNGTKTALDGNTFTMPSGHVYVDTEPITYSITYELNGGEAIGNPTSYTVESSDFTLTEPMKDGYDFAGWTGTGLNGATDTVTIAKGSTGERSYTATWTLNNYSITYDLDGGTVETANPESYTIETATFTLNNPTKGGYTFAGWTGTRLNGATDTVTIAKGSTGNRSYTATWTAHTYTVNFNANNGTGDAMESQGFTYDADNTALTTNAYTREGYNFAGWNTQADGNGTDYTDGQEVQNLTADAGGEITLYAKWNIITYTITYDLNEGSLVDGETNPTSYTIESDDFTLTNPTKNGYTFAGWTGTDLDEATLTATIPAGSTGDRSYTATWTKNGFTPHDPNTPEFAYHSLILSGQIGVIFHVYIPDALSPSGCTMDFDVSGDISQNNPGQKYYEVVDDGGTKIYLYKCYINSVQMADDIHAKLSYNGGSITETYTAKRYLDSLIADTTQPEDVTELGMAIKDYGSYVQPMLADHNGWEIGKKHAAMDSAYEYDDTDFTSTDKATKDYAITCSIPDGSGIESASFALVLDSETAIELYLATKDGYTGNVGAYVDSNTTDNMAVKNGNEYVVSIGNISAHLLGKSHTVRIVTQYDNMEAVSFDVNVSALSYVQSAIHNDSTAMKRAVTSLYRYWDATMTYRRNRSDIYGGGE